MPLTATAGPCLAADIGGTNARLAIVERLGDSPCDIRQYACHDFADFEAITDAYLTETGRIMPKLASFAMAGPVLNNKARLTNGPWEIDGDAFRERMNLDACLLVNDFAGLAQALPWLGTGDLMRIGPELEPGDGPRLVTGPGTGLGVATLVEKPDRRIAVFGEGGHACFAPNTELEDELLRWFRNKSDGPVAVEYLVSGRGLVNLHQALADIHGRSEDSLTGPEITQRGLDDPSSTARQTIMHFLAILGSFAGDLALINGALGGVYIGGGIVPRLRTLVPESPLRDRFEAKGRYRSYLAAIPIWLITAKTPAITGAAACLLDPACR